MCRSWRIRPSAINQRDATSQGAHHDWKTPTARDAGRHHRGILSFAFLKVVGEPQVDRAIAFETQMDEARAKAAAEDAKAMGMPMPAEGSLNKSATIELSSSLPIGKKQAQWSAKRTLPWDNWHVTARLDDVNLRLPMQNS
jgi:hypothetical protein